MTQAAKHGPCPCGKSSDAFATFANGSKFCFSCNKPFNSITFKEEKMLRKTLSYRGHSAALLDKYKVPVYVDEENPAKPIAVDYHYPAGVTKRRIIEGKKFVYISEAKAKPDLYLADRFDAGSALAITITEGEEDALSVLEMFGDKYPAVSVRSSSSAVHDCSARYDYLMSFQKIYLCFDNDEPGQKAVEHVAALFPFGKCFIVKKGKYKDANEYHMNNAAEEYRKIWYNARPYTPENIISSFGDFHDILSEKNPPAIGSYPFPELQRMTRGIRSKEFTLIKGMEGLGKTEVIGAIEVHNLKENDYNIGVIHLEEPVKRSLQRIASYDLLMPVHLAEDIQIEAVDEAVAKIVRRDGRLYFYKNFGSNSVDGVINQIRWLVKACNCKLIFLDHITRIVTGMHGADERSDLDYISTKFSQMTEELDFGLVAITHVNDDGKTRGSRNISKEAATVINIARDHLNENPEVRNTTLFTLEKNRWASATGPAGAAYFNELTFTLEPKQQAIEPPLE